MIKENIKEKIKLEKAYLNYYNIIEKKLPYKYSYLDEWILKKSKLLLDETIEDEVDKKYRVYKRGTIIKVDFGVNLGSEMSQVHFAIVLNNYDNQKNNILTVVPLTSKNNKFNLNLGPLVIGKLIDKVKLEMIKIGYNEEYNSVSEDTPENRIKLKKLLTLLSYYKSNEKNTYACCSLITTISKTRIFPPINEYDIIGRAKCSTEVMEMIDKEVLDKITKIDLTKI